MILKIRYAFLSLLFFFSTCLLVAQTEDNLYKHHIGGPYPSIDDTISEVEIDSLGFFLEEEETFNFDDDIDNNASMVFSYFEWMPGYGVYETFDILSTHYRHTTPAKVDTLILGTFCPPAKFRVTSNYGRRRKRMHYGIDIGYPLGTPVVAAFDGIVRISKSNAGGYGNLIVIRHENNLETYYAHLSKRLVNPGQMVHAGDTIGLGGNTGRSYGSHLHFETRYLGTPFNPARIIDFTTHTLKCDTLYSSGQGIKITTPPAKTAANENNAAENKVYHRIREGETLSTIARKYRTSVAAIKRLNGLKSDFIRAGRTLRVR